MRISAMSNKIAKPVSVKHRNPLIYIEKARVFVEENEVVAESESGRHVIPVATTAAILLAHGVSITTEAIKIASRRECCVMWVGGGGTPIYSWTGNYKSPKNIIKQTKLLLNEKVRLEKAKKLLIKRNEFIPSDMPLLDESEIKKASSVENLLLIEARWAKKVYHIYNKKYGIEKNEHIKLSNHMTYGLVTPIIVAMGLNPNVGLLHGLNRGGGLVFDIADLIKPLCSHPISCQATKENMSGNQLKREVLKVYRDKNLHNKIIEIIEDIWLIVECESKDKKEKKAYKAILGKYGRKVGTNTYIITSKAALNSVEEEIKWCNTMKIHIKYKVIHHKDVIDFIE